jgi:hypothetical protein
MGVVSAPSNTERPGSGAAGSSPGDRIPLEEDLFEGVISGEANGGVTAGNGAAAGAKAGSGVARAAGSPAAGSSVARAPEAGSPVAEVPAAGLRTAGLRTAGGTEPPATAALGFLGEADDGETAQRPALHVARHPAQRRRPLRTTLLGTLCVVLLVTGGVLLVPRPNSTPLELVDVAAAAAAARSQLGFAPAVPVGPTGWTVTTASARHGTDGIITWHVGMMTAQGNYAGFEQAEHSTFTWENALDSGGRHIGTVNVDGVVWDHMEKVERGTTTLILRRYGKVTLVTAHGGGLPDAMALIRSLPPDALT